MLFSYRCVSVQNDAIALPIELHEVLLVVFSPIIFSLSYSCCWNNAGHGGSRAAKFVKEHLFDNLLKHHKFLSDTKAAIGIYICAFSDYVWTSFIQDLILLSKKSF